ncbi:MAG: transcriptional regulator [Acidobacteria bacterium]|nr:MAG: transcriptional regulator [Acidobacteriota bacterium]
MTRATEIANKHEYAKLLVEMLPHVIHTEGENERYIAALEMLLAKRDRTPEESRIVELLTLLIEDFEEKNYSLPPATPRDVVRHLMESNGLRQVDLIDVFGAESIVSEVLNGRRDLAKSHIENLSMRFNLSPELFFEQRPKADTSDASAQEEKIAAPHTRRIANKLLTRRTKEQKLP